MDKSSNSNNERVKPEMVLIPAGEFLMGSPLDDEMRQAREPEQFLLHLDAYQIGKYPITVHQYRAFIEAEGYHDRRWWTPVGWQARLAGFQLIDGRLRVTSVPWDGPRSLDNKYAWEPEEDWPVYGISWFEAYAYTQWLSETTDRVYRLPTEAEWEKAARGGLQLSYMDENRVPDRKWPWGNEEPHPGLLNFSDSELYRPTRVDSYPAGRSPYGVFDMAGNVSEWCVSAWTPHYEHPEYNHPLDEVTGGFRGAKRRVRRGGTWYSRQLGVRCSYRTGNAPFSPSDRDGFRVACDAD